MRNTKKYLWTIEGRRCLKRQFKTILNSDSHYNSDFHAQLYALIMFSLGIILGLILFYIITQ